MQEQPSPAERARMAHLASAVPPRAWIVVVPDAADAVLDAVAQATAPVLALAGPDPLALLPVLRRRGGSPRMQVGAGDPLAWASGWRAPVGLLCLRGGRGPRLRPLLAAWARHVVGNGHVAFFGGAVPLDLLPDLPERDWVVHRRGEEAFLLTRKPYG
jgi:hypothetical protein